MPPRCFPCPHTYSRAAPSPSPSSHRAPLATRVAPPSAARSPAPLLPRTLGCTPPARGHAPLLAARRSALQQQQARPAAVQLPRRRLPALATPAAAARMAAACVVAAAALYPSTQVPWLPCQSPGRPAALACVTQRLPPLPVAVAAVPPAAVEGRRRSERRALSATKILITLSGQQTDLRRRRQGVPSAWCSKRGAAAALHHAERV